MVAAVGRPGLDVHLGLVGLNLGLSRHHFLAQASEIQLDRDRGISGQEGTGKEKRED